MLDPLTAISLASSIVQFVQFATDVVTTSCEIYNDEWTSNRSKADLDAALVAKNLLYVTRRLRPRDQVPTEDEAALFQLRDRCEILGNELIRKFEGIAKTAQTGRWKKGKEKWQSLRNALRRVWQEKEIREMEASLLNMRSQFELQFGADTWNNVKAIQLQMSQSHDMIVDKLLSGFSNIQVSITRYYLRAFLVVVFLVLLQGYERYSDNILRGRRECQERAEKISDWLTGLDFAQRQQDILATRHPDTGNWLLSSTEFQDWFLQSDRPFTALWLEGIPGSGKTVLSSVVIDHLKKHTKTPGVDSTVIYVYYDYRDQVRQSLPEIIASLLKQLIQSHSRKPLSKRIEAFYNDHSRDRTRPSLNAVFNTLQSELRERQEVFLVVDALDECDDNEGARAKLLNLIGALTPYVKVILTSRPHINVSNYITTVRRLEVLASVDDLTKYVEGRLLDANMEFGNIVRGHADLQRQIVETVVSKAKGMFLLAKLHMDMLTEKADLRTVRRSLNDLPTELSDAYQNTMARIEMQKGDRRKLAKQVLYWISNTVRPLHVTELQNALAVEPGEASFDEEGIKTPEYLLLICSGLVIIEQESRIIRLVHYSVEEYFQRFQQSLLSDSHENIATISLTYLSYTANAAFNCSIKEEIDALHRKNPFYAYAAQYWGDHARKAPEDRIQNTISKFLNLEGNLFCAVQSKIILEDGWPQARVQIISSPVPKLWVAAGFGLIGTVKMLLAKGVEVDAHTNYLSRPHPGDTALQVASHGGFFEVVLLLLQHGANLQPFGGDHTPLLVAARNGHAQIVELLLLNGVDPSLFDKTFSNALGAAAFNGHEDIVQMLIEKGAAVNPHGDPLIDTPLMAASMNGHVHVLQLLLQAGAEINEGRSFHGIEIIKCRRRGNDEFCKRNYRSFEEEIRNRIIYQPHSFEVYWGDCENPLHCASFTGHYDAVRLLLEHRATVDLCGVIWGTALQAASFHGYHDIARLLIENGADVNLEGAALGNALQAACIYGHESIVTLLLDNGADIRAEGGGFFGNALQTAHARRHTHVVHLLLGKRSSTYRFLFDLCSWFASQPGLRSTRLNPWCFSL